MGRKKQASAALNQFSLLDPVAPGAADVGRRAPVQHEKSPLDARLTPGAPLEVSQTQESLVQEPVMRELIRRQDFAEVIRGFEHLAKRAESPVRAIRHQAARAGQFREMPPTVPDKTREVLKKRGVDRLYSHQAEVFQHVSAGKNVVVVTPTASGKTLCYNLPILTRLSAEPEARALYLFPTKALAEDQLHEFNAVVEELGAGIRAFTYDGDTPQDARKAIRSRANVILTNPDMLHSGILPHHTKWAKAFENLRYIVIDELHYYRGVYGSHLANLLRRLKRICEFYGSAPRFICCSATIANPKELAETLTESPFELVDKSGAPTSDRYIVFYNPPVVNRELGIRRSYIHESRRVALELLDHGQQILVFTNNHLATEVLVTYLKDACDSGPVPSQSVRGYRGGYLPRERREIEQRLRAGEIRAVVATNALELGIDIGSLDAVVMAGYPGAIASTWQRAGRAGRRQTPSVAVLVASSAPLDQYIVEHPDYFFGQSPEHAHVNADNLEILLSHVKCAAFELPIAAGEKFGPHDVTDVCTFLKESGFLHQSGAAWHWTSESYPADAVSLRAVTSDNFVVVDVTGESKVIAEVSFPVAITALHEKAIYLHQAQQYHVDKFDYHERKAYVRRVECDYYTDAIDYTQVNTLREFASAPIGGSSVQRELPASKTITAETQSEAPPGGANVSKVHGEVRVNRQIVGFKKIKFYTNENVGAGKLSMPEQEMHTTACWLRFPQAFLQRLAEDFSPTEIQNGLNGLSYALRTIAALLLMCDPHDIGVSLTGVNGVIVWEPNLYLYDNYPGGVGLSAPLYRMDAELRRKTHGLIEGCACESGCPSCTGAPGETGERGKEAALAVLKAMAPFG